MSQCFRRSRVLCLVSASLFASGARAQSNDCSLVDRRSLAACAVEQSPAVRMAVASVRESEGRREAARPFLPSNPVVMASVGTRAGAGTRATNWSVTLAQELELAGQSFVRSEAAGREVEADSERLNALRRDVAASAWRAYFEVLAFDERVALAKQLELSTRAVAETAAAMSKQGLSAPLDAVVADAAVVEVTAKRLTLERERAEARALLTSLAGATTATGTLTPLPAPATTNDRAEVLALRAASEAAKRRVELFSRARAPNVTVSVFAQNDGFDERVFGVGLGIPVPLPQPIGRTKAGELAEATAADERVLAQLEAQERAVALERSNVNAEYQRAVDARALYSTERLAAAAENVRALSAQVSAGRLSVRDALLAQAPLFSLLAGDIDARLSLCLASVHLRRAAGATLEGALE